MFDYEVKIANTQLEIEKALRLRYEVFNLETGKGSTRDFNPDLDTDAYDKNCDHLIVIDKDKDKVVGTYRLCLAKKVNKDLGFYSEKTFDINNIKKINSNTMELGRACVHKDYRDQLVINLLWSGIAKYIKDHSIRYLFGSVRLNTNDPLEASKTFKWIKQKYYAPSKFRVFPLSDCCLKGLDKKVVLHDTKEVLKKLHPLVKGYLRLGVRVCGEPAVNPDFGTIVMFILLDIERMSPAYKRHYFGV